MAKFKFSKKTLSIFVVVLSLLIGVLAFVFRKSLSNLQDLGYLGVFLVNMIGSATIFLPVPALVVTVAAGALFNPILAALFSAAGSTIGELTGYMAGRGGSELIKDSKKVQKVKAWMNKYGLWVIFVLAFIPNPLFDIAGALAGASKTPVWKYVIVVFPGKVFKFLLLAYSGFGIFKLIG